MLVVDRGSSEVIRGCWMHHSFFATELCFVIILPTPRVVSFLTILVATEAHCSVRLVTTLVEVPQAISTIRLSVDESNHMTPRYHFLCDLDHQYVESF